MSPPKDGLAEDMRDNLACLQAHDPLLDAALSRLYRRYHLKVAWMLEQEAVTLRPTGSHVSQISRRPCGRASRATCPLPHRLLPWRRDRDQVHLPDWTG